MCEPAENQSDVEYVGVGKKGMKKKHVMELKSLTQFGDIIDVPSDGNCGYWAIMKALQETKLLTHTSVHRFRVDVSTFGCKNESYFCGENPSYRNMAGDPVVVFKPIIRDKFGEVKDAETYFQREIINIFFDKNISYEKGLNERRDQ